MSFKKDSLQFIAFFLIELIIFLPFYVADVYAAQPTINNVQATASYDSASIKWQTDISSSSVVNYGIDTLMELSKSDSQPVTSHEVNLNPLSSNTKYYYSVQSCYNSSCSTGSTNDFTTSATPAPSKIIGLTNGSITKNSIVLEWNESSSSYFGYYNVYRNGNKVANISSQYTTQYTDTGLSGGTTYKYEVSAVNIDTLEGPKSDALYATTLTPDTTAPFITNATISSLSLNSVTIAWVTNEDANSTVIYGTSLSNLNGSQSSSNYETEHSVSLNDLQNGTTYFYKIRSCDADGNCVEKTDTQPFTPSEISDLSIELTVPALYNQGTVPVTGTATPHTKVKFFVNDIYKAIFTMDRNTNGSISFDVPGFSSGNNTLKAIVEDSMGNQEASQVYNVQIDSTPPIVEITDLPSVLSSENVVINGTSNELVNVNIYARLVSSVDITPPGKVTNFHTDNVNANSVTLAWANINDTDFNEYIIYRNDLPIATVVSSPFEDNELVNAGTPYRYEIAAVDTNCNIGEKTILNVQTPAGNITYNETPQQEAINCLGGNQTPKYTLTSQYPDFREEISLDEGLNEVIIEALDMAGNSVKKVYQVYYDSTAPQILETNLDVLTPSYIADVTITGTVSEDSYVCVFINSEPQVSSYRAEEVTQSSANISKLSKGSKYCANSINKSFSIDIELRRDAEYVYNQNTPASQQTSNMLVSSGTAWTNKIKIVATDQVGLTSDPEEGDILYALCAGTGSDWSILTTDVMPTEIVARHLLEGIAQVGFTVDVAWRGSGSRPGITDVDIAEGYPMDMNSELKKNYDTEWISQISDTWSDEYDKGYVLIDLKAQDPSTGNALNRTNWTMYQKEENLSKHHQGECFNAPFSDKNYIKSAGCVRIPLTIEVSYERNVSVKVGNKYQIRKETVIQKQCVDVEVLIQPRIPPDIIPNSFLKTAVTFLNDTINLIDTILEPLEKVMKATMIACFVMWAVLWVKKVSEGFSCLTLSISDPAKGCKCIASETGLTCTKDGKPGGEEDEKCKSCMEAKINTKSFEKIMHWTCDRIMCPAVPSYENYIKKNVKNEKSNCFGKVDTDNKYTKDKNDNALLCSNAPKDLVGTTGPIIRPEQSKAGIEKATCCDEEYMQEWGPGCVMMNELDESYILRNPQNQSVLGQVWRSISNFKLCRPGDNNERQVNIDGQWFVMKRTEGYDQLSEEQKEKQFEWTVWLGINRRDRVLSEGQIINDTEKVEATGEPLTGNQIIRANCRKYGVDSGYKYNEGKWPRYVRTANTETTTNVLELYCTYSVDEMKSRTGTDINISKKEDQTQTLENYVYIYDDTSKGFKVKLNEGDSCDQSNDKLVQKQKPITTTQGKTIREAIPESIVRDACSGFAEDYIVDPTDTIFHSIQCVCLSALYAYLKMYRQILALIRDCFQTILITGDGSSGVCQAVLSYYVCDLLYYMFTCFKNYSGFGTKGESEGGIVGFFKGIVGAGAEVQKNVQERYGETNMYKVMFIDKKLIHSACMMFFGADTDIDLTAMAEQSLKIPIASTVSVFPANRRFVGFNPIDGITNHVYQVGLMIVSGADNMNYKVLLVCSNDNQCDSTYFTNGRCDCSYIGREVTKDITNEFGGNGRLNQGQIINQEAYITISYGNQDALYRYDKVRVEYDYIANTGKAKTEKVEAKLSQVGSAPLASCSFDVLGGRYRCAVFEEPTTACITQGPTLEARNRYLTSWEPIQDGNIYNATDKQLKFTFKARRETTTGDKSKVFTAILKILDGTRELASVEQVIDSDTEKDYFFGDTSPQIIISDSWFSGVSSGDCIIEPDQNTINLSAVEMCEKNAQITCTKSANTATFIVQPREYVNGQLSNQGNNPITCKLESKSTTVDCGGKYRLRVDNFNNLNCGSTYTRVDKLTSAQSISGSVSKALTYTLTIYKPKSDSPRTKSDTVAKCNGISQVKPGDLTIYSGAGPAGAGQTASGAGGAAASADILPPTINDFRINGFNAWGDLGPIKIPDTTSLMVTAQLKDSFDTVHNNVAPSGLKEAQLVFKSAGGLIKSNPVPLTESDSNLNKNFNITSKLAMGLYSIYLEVKDSAGNIGNSTTIDGVWFGEKCIDNEDGVCSFEKCDKYTLSWTESGKCASSLYCCKQLAD